MNADIVKEGSLVLGIGDVDEHDGFVKLDAFFDQHFCRVEIVRRRIAFDAAIQKFVLREIGCEASDKAILPAGHSLRCGVTQNENTRPRAG